MKKLGLILLLAAVVPFGSLALLVYLKKLPSNFWKLSWADKWKFIQTLPSNLTGKASRFE